MFYFTLVNGRTSKKKTLQNPLSVATLGGEKSETKRFQSVRFAISPIQGHPTGTVEMKVLTIPKI